MRNWYPAMSLIAQNLPDELILEIICLLPLKCAIQCRCLNKTFNKLISQPKILQQLGFFRVKRNVFFRLSHEVDQAGYACDKISLNPPFVDSYGPVRLFPHMSSTYSGRILLGFSENSNQNFCVFNPFTGAYFIVPILPATNIALAGLVDDVSSPQYKLVAACAFGGDVKFFIFESENNSWRASPNGIKIERELITNIKSGHLSSFNCSQPAHIHGCLHWLRKDGMVLVFDVNNELPGTVKRPSALDDLVGYNVQLGEAGGSLILAVAYEGKILTYVLDHVEKRWQFRNLIADIIPLEGRLVYCDDDSLIFVAGNLRCDIDVYMYTIRRGECKKIGKLSGQTDEIQGFHPFVPTTASIPGCKFLKPKERLKEGEEHEELETLHCLHCLLLL